MGVFVRAVISGFGFNLGAALFRQVSRKLGFEEGSDGDSKRGDRTQDQGDGEEADDDADPDDRRTLV